MAEKMTIQQVRDEMNACRLPGVEIPLMQWIDAIDAHLAKLRAPVNDKELEDALEKYEFTEADYCYRDGMQAAITDFLARRFGEGK